MRSRLLYILIMCVLVQPAMGQTKQINKLRNQSAALQKQISESEKLLKNTRRDVSAQLGNLAVLNSQIGEQRKFVDGIQTEVSDLSNSLQGLEAELARLEKDLADCKHRYQRAMLYMFRNRTAQSHWAFVLSARNFRQMYRRLRYVAEYGKYQRVQAALIKEKEDEVQRRRNEITGMKQQKTQLLTEGKKQQAALQEKQKQQQVVVDDLNKRQAELQKNIAATRKQQANLNARIDQLVQAEIAAAEARRKAEEKRRREEEARRKAEAAKRKAREEAQRKAAAATSTTAGKKKKAAPKAVEPEREERTATPRFVEADNADRKLSGGFAANRGRLPVPITGSYAITAHYGSYSPVKGVTLDNKGINITGQTGAQARAVYDGEVSRVFTIGGLHNVIVRHGSYMTVYCNLSSVSVRQGQKVSARQTLGAVARDASGNCTLQFQLWKETARLNPEGWIGR